MRKGSPSSGGGGVRSWGVRKGGKKGKEERTDVVTSPVRIAPMMKPFFHGMWLD